MMCFTKLAAIGTTALLVLLALIGCESDADKIREANESLRSPTPTTALPTTSPKQTEIRQVITRTETPTGAVREPTKTKQHIEVETTPTATKHLEATIDALDLQEGDCIVSTLPEEITLETVVIVPCNEEWQYRVLNSFQIQSSNYPSDIEFEQHAYSNCDRRYTYTLVPTEEGWTSVLWSHRKVDCIQESFGLSLTDPAKLDRLVGQNSLEAGQCFNEAPETDDLLVEIVSCTGAWDYQVVEIVPLPEDDSFPGDSYIESRADRDCGTNTDYYFHPTSESWDLGDRQILCASTN